MPRSIQHLITDGKTAVAIVELASDHGHHHRWAHAGVLRAVKCNLDKIGNIFREPRLDKSKVLEQIAHSYVDLRNQGTRSEFYKSLQSMISTCRKEFAAGVKTTEHGPFHDLNSLDPLFERIRLESRLREPMAKTPAQLSQARSL